MCGGGGCTSEFAYSAHPNAVFTPTLTNHLTRIYPTAYAPGIGIEGAPRGRDIPHGLASSLSFGILDTTIGKQDIDPNNLFSCPHLRLSQGAPSVHLGAPPVLSWVRHPFSQVLPSFSQARCLSFKYTIRHHEQLRRSFLQVHHPFSGAHVLSPSLGAISVVHFASIYHEEGRLQKYWPPSDSAAFQCHRTNKDALS